VKEARRRVKAGVRVPLLIATAVATVVALVVVYVVVSRVGGHNELLSQQSEDRAVARVLVTEVDRGLTPKAISSVKQLLADEHMHATVVRGGRVLHAGPAIPRGAHVARVTLPAGRRGSVTVVSLVDSLTDPPFLVVLLSTGALALVLGVAVLTNVILTRETRRRVSLAVDAADRISSGDFSTRLGSQGPEPLRSLGRAMDEMAARLEEADSTQRELLADLAHEIATPIHALSGYAKAVLDGTISADGATAAIESQTERLAGLLDELAELRLLDDERPARSEPVELHHLVDQVVHGLAPIAGHVRVRKKLAPVGTSTDPELVRTIVHNLLTNAFRFTPRGGSVFVSTSRRGQVAVVSVRDSGPGIAPRHQARVFDRFYRAESARDRVTGGTGLGLAIARRAAERLGGRIELESELSKGSEFRLVLPEAAPVATAV
jgi:two-component system sensor histidine kinase BaeS